MKKTAICGECGESFEYEASERFDFAPGICGACCDLAGAREAAEARQATYTERNVPPRYRSESFATFVAVTPSQRSALAAVQEHAREGVFLLGPPGCGKTHLAAAAIMDGPAGSLFVSTTDLLDDIRAGFDGDSRGLLERAKRAPLLALDDLGSEAVKDWARDRLHSLLNWRWNQRLPVIATTNCRPKIIGERIGDAGVSRLAGLCRHRIDMQGPDARQHPRARPGSTDEWAGHGEPLAEPFAKQLREPLVRGDQGCA
jgi:DNA replication protein DnaC